MLYDLNIAWSPSIPPSDLDRTLRFAKSLGYDVVALNHPITTSIPNAPSPITSPIPPLPASPSLPTLLRRVTLTITDPSTTNYRLLDFSRAYDLLALRPTSEKAFSWACSGTTEPPALISLDLTTFLGFHIHHRTAMAAVHRGSRFEICYGHAVAAGVDARQRVNFIGNVLSLLRATKGRGIVVSSEARGALTLRAPADVVNLMAVWGLGPERGMEALGAGARAVVVNEGVRRRGFRGVVEIVRTVEEGEGAAEARREGVERGREAGKKKGQGQGQKRKSEGGGGGGGAEGQAVSKRQAKKMKKDGVVAAAK